MVVAFEGLDGVGKTTISKRFAEEHQFVYIERPLYELFDIENKTSENYKVAISIENKVYNETKSSELKACLTSLGLIYLHKCLASDSKNIVLDRGLISNYSFNGDECSRPLFEAMLKMEVYPDITFLLYASAETRRQRIKARNPFDKDLTDEDVVTQTYEKILKFIEEYNLPVIIIDTNNKTIENVLKEVNSKFKEVIENGNIKSRRKCKPSK